MGKLLCDINRLCDILPVQHRLCGIYNGEIRGISSQIVPRRFERIRSPAELFGDDPNLVINLIPNLEVTGSNPVGVANYFNGLDRYQLTYITQKVAYR